MQHAVENSDLFLFADDTNIACQTSILEYQKDLSNNSSWLCSNKLTLNNDKTTLVRFNKHREASNRIIILLNNTFKPKYLCCCR